MELEVSVRKKLGDFRLDAGFECGNEIFSLLGQSGCGKSMTLKCIAGIETPDEGRIVLNGRVLYDSQKRINLPPQKRKVGCLFQDYALFPNMTLEKNIMSGMKKEERGQAGEYIKRFRLTGLEKHYPHQLSGGQKQRAAMARMLAAKPEAILLDEPFSALDSFLRWELEQEMQDFLTGIGKPVVFVSHNRDEVYRMSSRVSCMQDGFAQPAQPVREFFDNPRTRAACLLSGCKNISAVRVLDEHHLLAEDWGVVLPVPQIPDGVTSVGIRAHHFREIPSEKDRWESRFPVAEYRVREDPFEWNISFRAQAGKSWIQWKLPKSERDMETSMPEQLYADSREVLLLKG